MTLSLFYLTWKASVYFCVPLYWGKCLDALTNSAKVSMGDVSLPKTVDYTQDCRIMYNYRIINFHLLILHRLIFPDGNVGNGWGNGRKLP